MLPNKKTENWQWSDFTSLALPQGAVDLVLPQSNGATGTKVPPLSFEAKNGLIALNQADGLAIVVEKSLDKPLTLSHRAGCTQFSLTIKAGQEATLIERCGDFAVNSLAQIKLEKGARLKHYRFFRPKQKNAGTIFS